MGKSNELYQQTIGSQGDDSDYQYFQWLTDKEWQEYLYEEELNYHKRYGYGATFILLWSEFLKKNNINN